MEFPNNINNIEASTGLLLKSISVNGYYLFVESCNIMVQQEISPEWFLQAGPRASIFKYGNRVISGNIKTPIRIDGDGKIETSIQQILLHAQNPDSTLIINTNHNLITDKIIADSCDGVQDNHLLSFKCMAIKELSINASLTSEMLLNIDLIGVLDTRDESSFIGPSDGYMLGRTLTLADCRLNRTNSLINTLTEISINIQNKLEPNVYITPKINNIDRTDLPEYLKLFGTVWEGSFEQFLRRGIEASNYIHGGSFANANLTLDFANVSVLFKQPLFKTTEQPFSKDILKRKSSFYSQNSPNLHNASEDMFTIS